MDRNKLEECMNNQNLVIVLTHADGQEEMLAPMNFTEAKKVIETTSALKGWTLDLVLKGEAAQLLTLVGGHADWHIESTDDDLIEDLIASKDLPAEFAEHIYASGDAEALIAQL
jgi:hypothetical protein